ncbi:restriction endonuclease subunit S [Limosilactobacillus reuteri]|uniref:restriction endonuclease subunit S n=1 Tax=Limosilactobacillus reuteri TaxID=1598 RepID=UPI001E52C5F0|nr:restriction endonuclease subunit S [Limosilactobacillus reuteri]MCC4370359.1 restriction endonuclease subunit S [Limosilactobacillus reuteri]
MNKGWEQHKLGKVSKIVRGASPRPIKDPKWFEKDSHVGWIRISDVTEQNGRIRHLTQHLSKAGETKTRVLEQPHLLLSIAASVGFPAINYVPIGVHDGFLIFLNSKFNIDYMFYWLEKFRPLWRKYGQPGSQINLNSDIVSNTRLALPKEAEQSKVSNFLNKVELLITLQQRKLEILIKLKQSFLTKIMANNIDKNPELYFNSASIKWLKQELSNLTIKEFKGNTKLNDTKTGKTEYLDAERLNGNVPLFIDKPINTLKSDILILWDGSKAGSVYYGFEGSLGSTLKAIRLNPKLVNSFFVYQQLKSKQDVIFNKYRTPNIPHVIKNFTKVYPIYFPSMAVQNKIARFLGNLDTLIEIQQKSIKDHKVIKKYLLQKLFI